MAEISVDSFNPVTTAVIVADALPGPVVSAEGGSVELVSYEPEEIVVRASVQQPCLLVFSEIYYPPGWSASVDSQETVIYQTDYALRSVYLTPGDHTVTMRYTATRLRTGLVMSLIAAAALTGLGVWPGAWRKGGTPA